MGLNTDLTLSTDLPNPNEFVSVILLTNALLRAFISNRSLDFLFVTETWLKNTVGDNQISLENYNLYSLANMEMCVFISESDK